MILLMIFLQDFTIESESISFKDKNSEFIYKTIMQFGNMISPDVQQLWECTRGFVSRDDR